MSPPWRYLKLGPSIPGAPVVGTLGPVRADQDRAGSASRSAVPIVAIRRARFSSVVWRDITGVAIVAEWWWQDQARQNNETENRTKQESLVSETLLA